MLVNEHNNAFAMFAHKHSKGCIDNQGILRPDGLHNTIELSQSTSPEATHTAQKSVNIHLDKSKLHNQLLTKNMQ